MLEDKNGHLFGYDIMMAHVFLNGEQLYGAVAASEDQGWIVCIDGETIKEDGDDGCIFLEPRMSEDGKLQFILRTGEVELKPTHNCSGCSNCQ